MTSILLSHLFSSEFQRFIHPRGTYLIYNEKMPKDGLLFKLIENILLPLFGGKTILKELGYFKSYY